MWWSKSIPFSSPACSRGDSHICWGHLFQNQRECVMYIVLLWVKHLIKIALLDFFEMAPVFYFIYNIYNIQYTTVSQCPAKVFSEAKWLLWGVRCLNKLSKIFQKRRIFKLLLEATHVGYPWNQFRESNISYFILCQNSCTCTCIYTSARYPFPTQFLGTCSVKPQKSVGLNSHRRGEWCRTRVFLGNLSPSMDR